MVAAATHSHINNISQFSLDRKTIAYTADKKMSHQNNSVNMYMQTSQNTLYLTHSDRQSQGFSLRKIPALIHLGR